MKNQISDISLGQAARLAGFGYLVIIILAIFAEFFVRGRLVIPGDLQATTQNLQVHGLLFRVGICSYLVAAVFDVMVAVALYVLLKPVNRSLALLAAWFRLIHATIFGISLQNLFSAAHLVSDGEYLKSYEPDELYAQVMLYLEGFEYGWLVGLVFFGLHCLLLGCLILRSGFIPRFLGGLLLVAAAGYLTDSFAHFLLADYRDYQTIFLLIVGVPALIAEVALCVWLLVKGRRLQLAA